MEFFISDSHLGHTNIIKYCSRPFKTADEMNTILIANINVNVSINDTLWHLGDFSWGDPIPFLRRIRCRNINIMLGNHDRHHAKAFQAAQKDGIIQTLVPYGQYLDTSFHNKRVTLCHYPMRSWNAKAHGAWHLYGHVHNTIQDPDYNSVDVGVDAWEYKPVSWPKIEEHMKRFV